MGALTIKTLGAPGILHGGAAATISVRKTLALALYLAVTGRPQSRANLVALLWPDADEAHGLLNLRQTLLRLRQALAPDADAHLITTGDLVRLDLGVGGLVDVTQLANATRTQTPPDEALAALRAYEGPFLDHLDLDNTPDFIDWVMAQRAHWDACFDLIAERHIRRLIDEGRAETASALGQSWTTLRPDAEVAYRMLATAYAAMGDIATARLTLALATRRWAELGLPLAPTTETLRAQLDATPTTTSATLPTSTATPATRAMRLPFVGRRDAFTQARQTYQQTLAGAPHLLLTHGEAGVGKSRLVSAITQWAQAQGADVAIGHAYELSGRLPYQPLMELLRARLAAERAPDDLLEDSWLTELQRLVPDLHDRYPDLPQPVDDVAAGVRLLEAIAELGIALARQRPLVWLVEDLHWADEATRAALLYLLKRWCDERIPALLLTTIRTEEIGASPPLATWLATAQETANVTEIALAPLSAEQTTQAVFALFDETASADLCAWLYAETHGNPLYLEHVAQALVERGAATWQANNALRITAETKVAALVGWLPETLRELLLRRVRRLDTTTQQMLAAAAVLGGRFDEATLAPVAGLDENALLTALEAAERSQLIRVEAGAYIFTHDKVAEALTSDLTLARRRVYHRRALQTLEAGRDTGASPADLARLAIGAAAWEQAATYSLAAANAAQQIGAHRDALRFYEQIISLITTPPIRQALQPLFTDEALWDLYESLGILYLTLGETAQASALYSRLLADARTRGSHVLEGRALTMSGRLALQYELNADAAHALLLEARQLAHDNGDIQGQLHAERMLAVVAEEQENLPLAWEYIQRALQLARESQQGLARILIQVGAVARSRGQWESASAAAEEALILFTAEMEAATAPEAPEHVTPYQSESPLRWSRFYHQIEALTHAAPTRANNSARQWGANGLTALGIARLHLGEGATGRAALEMAWQIFTERNERRFHHHYLAYRTLGWLESGAYERALHEIEQTLDAIQTAVERPIDLTNVTPLCAVVDTHQALFQLDAARQPLDQVLSFAAKKSTGVRLLATTRAVTQHALAGEWEAAHTAALQAQAIREALPTFLPWFDFARYYETEALLRAGERERAEADATRLSDHLDGNQRYRLLYLRMQALLDRDAGDHAAAIAHLTEALALATQMELPCEVWQIAAALAESYANQHDAPRAHDARTRAELTLTTLATQITTTALRDHFVTEALARLPSAS